MNKGETKKVACVIRHTPYGSSFSQDVIDAVLALGIYQLNITLMFMNDGVLQLLANNAKEQEKNKASIPKKLTALEFYDIDKVFVCKDSLEKRGLSKTSLVAGKVIETSQWQSLSTQQDLVLNF